MFAFRSAITSHCFEPKRAEGLRLNPVQGKQTLQHTQRSQDRAAGESSLSLLPRLRFLTAFLAFFPLLHAQETPVKSSPKGIETVFASTVTKLQVKRTELSLPVEWDYTNHMDSPLAVEKVESSCGCLSVSSDFPVLESGKSAKIHALFTPGQERGIISKTLKVYFVGFDSPVELKLEAEVEASVRLSQKELLWAMDDAVESEKTQIIDIAGDPDKPFRITGLHGVSESQYTITQKTIIEDQHYQLLITPVLPLTQGLAALQVRTNSPDPAHQVMVILLKQNSPTN